MEKVLTTYRDRKDKAELLQERIEHLDWLINRLDEMTDGHQEPELEGYDTRDYPLTVLVLKDYRAKHLTPQFEEAQKDYNLARHKLEEVIQKCKQAYRLTNVDLRNCIPEETLEHMEGVFRYAEQVEEEVKRDNTQINQVPF